MVVAGGILQIDVLFKFLCNPEKKKMIFKSNFVSYTSEILFCDSEIQYQQASLLGNFNVFYLIVFRRNNFCSYTRFQRELHISACQQVYNSFPELG